MPASVTICFRYSTTPPPLGGVGDSERKRTHDASPEIT